MTEYTITKMRQLLTEAKDRSLIYRRRGQPITKKGYDGIYVLTDAKGHLVMHGLQLEHKTGSFILTSGGTAPRYHGDLGKVHTQPLDKSKRSWGSEYGANVFGLKWVKDVVKTTKR
jgi:hypothetical protein